MKEYKAVKCGKMIAEMQSDFILLKVEDDEYVSRIVIDNNQIENTRDILNKILEYHESKDKV